MAPEHEAENFVIRAAVEHNYHDSYTLLKTARGLQMGSLSSFLSGPIVWRFENIH